MPRQIEEIAHLSVGRGCGFAGIAIVTFVVGLSGDMEIALRSGGFLALIGCLVLLLLARSARSRPYKQTEVWLMLPKPQRPSAATAQQIISRCLRDAYLYFALHAALFAVGMFGLSVVVGVMAGARVA